MIIWFFIRLRPSRGCSPFRLYSHEPDFYIYYSVRDIFLQIENKILMNILLKLTSAVVIVPAGNNQEADQHQYCDAGDPAPHSAGSVISADHGIAQPRVRIGKTWISHGHPPPWFGTFSVVSNEGNPLAVAAVPNDCP